MEELEPPTSMDEPPPQCQGSMLSPKVLNLFVSSSEGMHRLGGSGGSSPSDGSCADPGADDVAAPRQQA